MRWVWEQRGSQIVEFALIAPILIFLVLCVPIVGMAVRARMVVEVAAREGARTYALTGNEDQAKARAYQEVVQYGQLPLTSGTIPPFSLNDVKTRDAGGCAEVTVDYRQPTFVPYLDSLIGGDSNETYFNLQGRACFVKERR
jgi:hypothetical protein